jgi:hypothetical protein
VPSGTVPGSGPGARASGPRPHPGRVSSGISATACAPRMACASRQCGIAAQAIDGVLGSLRAGKAGYEWVSTPFFLDLALRKP